ncbi:MAG: hypothetical protein AMXMBFR33_11130 [Candidatus Xenobia bacterium]
MRTLVWVFLLGATLLLGCGEQGGQAGGGQVVAPQPTTADLKVILDLAGASAVPPQVGFPESAASFVLEVEDPVAGGVLAGPVTLERQAGQARLEQFFPDLPVGPLRLLVTTLDPRGARLGLSDQIFNLAAPESQATISSLFMPGPTREIGLISIGQQGVNGPSRQPAISSDGRFVAFSSSATNLLSTLSTGTPVNRIYVRDRLTGVVRLGSLVSPTSQIGGITDGTSNTLLFSETSPLNGSTADGTSNTLLFTEVTGGDQKPDLSGDGRFVVYERQVDLRSGTEIHMRDTRGRLANKLTPATIVVGTQTLTIASGSDPRISEDGRFVVYTARITGQRDQIVLYDRFSNTTVLATGTLSAVTCSRPVMTPDAGQIFFFSGQFSSGFELLVHNRAAATTTRIGPLSTENVPCAVSRDGNLVAVNSSRRLLLIDRTQGTTTELPRPDALAIEGAPSLSADGRFVTFCSSRPDLVSNDLNARRDAFVLDRSNGVISRLNVSNDGTAVEGGVELSGPPVIARDGSRIAFASDDTLLVPNDNNNATDIFSAVNPTTGRLYLAQPSSIMRFDNLVTARETLTPAATITSPSLGPATADLFLDTLNDRLYVATGPGAVVDRVLVFDQASTLNGSVTPALEVALPVQGRGLFLDAGRDTVFLGNTIRRNISSTLTLSGSSDVTTLPITPTALHVDTRRAELYAASFPGQVEVFAVQETPVRVRFLDTLANSIVRGLALDISPAGILGVNRANLMVQADGNRAAGTVPPNQLNRLARFSGNGSDPNQAFALVNLLAGTRTRFGTPPATIARGTGPLQLDVFTGTAYSADFARVLVFPVSANGDVLPSRILRPGFGPRGMAIDRTR